MNEGRIAIVVTDNCSRFFKGDFIKIIKFLHSVNKYYVQRLEGAICGEVREEDIQFVDLGRLKGDRNEISMDNNSFCCMGCLGNYRDT